MMRLAVAAVLLAALAGTANAGFSSSYRRRAAQVTDMPLDDPTFYVPPGYNAPQQVHLTQGDHVGKAVILSWITPNEPGNSTVLYGTAADKLTFAAESVITRYSYFNYTSGFIHHALLDKLNYSTKYYYAIGFPSTVRTFSFSTPPPLGPDEPYTFGLIGDLGQTYDSNITLTHYQENKADALIFCGDLSYADNYPDHDNRRWDSFGRMIERAAAYQPWIYVTGNHEIDYAPEIGEIETYKPFNHRYPTPFKSAGSISPQWYSVKRASAHIIVLASYSAYGKYTPQWYWLQAELKAVNRTETPWLIVALHSPWYNSYNYHYMEGETMRVQFESWLVAAKVDVVFAGHVHAYERSIRVSNIEYNITNAKCLPKKDLNAPVYVTIGDGGNIEGIANNYTEPQPSYSAYREASFGHAIFSIKNRTHAYYAWHRNQNDSKVVADEMWFTNRFYMPTDDSK